VRINESRFATNTFRDFQGSPMPTECNTETFGFEAIEGRKVVACFDGGRVSSDAGALLLKETDRSVRLIERFAACFDDYRIAGLVEHQVATLVGQRVYGLALGYEDLNDHDHLRRDPVFEVLASKLSARRKDCAAVAGKSTLNRLELSRTTPSRYHKISYRSEAVERLFVDLFLEAHAVEPKRIVLDLDATDDPLHGEQEGRFFHGYYNCYCYLPLYIFCGRHLLVAKLRRANADASAGAVEEIARVVAQIRERWPQVRIVLRADSGFTRDVLMGWCEDNDVDFLFGLAKNARLIETIGPELVAAADENSKTGRPARCFADFDYSTRDSWRCERRVVGKAEWIKPSAAEDEALANPGHRKRKKKKRPLTVGDVDLSTFEGRANPRFIVTSLSRDDYEARELYEQHYCARGEMENRIKECQLDLFSDRTSSHTMRANQLRLWFSAMAYVLLNALRRIALAGTRLADATCGTIRLTLLKIGARVQISVRRIKFAMAEAFPYADVFRAAWAALCPAA